MAIVVGDDFFPQKRLSTELKRISPPNFGEEAFRNTSHAVLADLNLPIYITTNYDQFLEEALRSRGREPVSEFCRWNKGLKDFAKTAGISSILDPYSKITPTKDRPLVYHLHGNFDTPESMVLTERDYINFVININREEEEIRLPTIIRMVTVTNTLLFIGYGLKDFRVIFQGVINPHSYKFRRKGIAVGLMPSGFTEEKKEQARKYLDSYTKNMYEIDVYWGDPLEFVRELRKRLDEFRSKRSRVYTS